MTPTLTQLSIAGVIVCLGCLIAWRLVKTGAAFDNLFKTEFDHDDN